MLVPGVRVEVAVSAFGGAERDVDVQADGFGGHSMKRSGRFRRLTLNDETAAARPTGTTKLHLDRRSTHVLASLRRTHYSKRETDECGKIWRRVLTCYNLSRPSPHVVCSSDGVRVYPIPSATMTGRRGRRHLYRRFS